MSSLAKLPASKNRVQTMAEALPLYGSEVRIIFYGVGGFDRKYDIIAITYACVHFLLLEEEAEELNRLVQKERKDSKNCLRKRESAPVQ